MSSQPNSPTAPLLLVTDAWHPQVNGVVQTWTSVRACLAARGIDLEVVHPGDALALTAPGEPQVRLPLAPGRIIRKALAGRTPRSLHIATEGPLGWAARAMALRQQWRFTTSFHTRFPEYLKARYGIPAQWTVAALRRFHHHSQAVLVPTQLVQDELAAQGFRRTRLWGRGVDGQRFHPAQRDLLDLPRPILLYVGRVAREKNLPAMLGMPFEGTKVIIGDGPEAPRLRRQYPDAVWLGWRQNDELAPYYDAADIFVFPSRTDTFGLVMLEAMACGCPVAAFPVAGPLNVVRQGVNGFLHEDLASACRSALVLDRQQVRETALERSWNAVTDAFLQALVPASASP